jgi:hypothetical protein
MRAGVHRLAQSVDSCAYPCVTSFVFSIVVSLPFLYDFRNSFPTLCNLTVMFPKTYADSLIALTDVVLAA